MFEFLVIGVYVVCCGEVQVDQCVLVVGVGFIGLGVMFFVRLCGVVVIVIDGCVDWFVFVCDYIGVVNIVVLGVGDEDELLCFSGGEFYDIVFDVIGNC